MSTNTFRLVYVCTRRGYELLQYIRKDFPALASTITCVGTSSEAMRAVPEEGKTVVLTSYMFYSNADPGADGKPEDKMTGTKLAALIKEKNPKAEVYLLSESSSDETIFNGTFKRDTNTGVPSKELKEFLQVLEKKLLHKTN